MSGIGGIVYLDGAPVEPERLAGTLNIIQHRGPDGTGVWINGHVALGHQMLQTTAESIHERQPLSDESGQVCLTADGRVDNIEEVRKALETAGAVLRDDTDAELLLKAYLIWGEDCPEKILGDFAFAVWDGREQKLFCARDFMGIKPFYYFHDGRKFLFGSELRQILDFPGVPNQFNEGMIGEYLAERVTSQEETIYDGIMRLPPAHCLVVKNGRANKRRYWDVVLGEELHYKNDQEYADQYFEIFKEAVRCRMRSHRPLAAYLSGGLDSSSVVCMAEWLRREGVVTCNNFEALSLVFPYLVYDESEYVKEVTRRWGSKATLLEPASEEIEVYEEQVARYKDLPDPPTSNMLNPLREHAKDSGCRVLLTGKGGDQWLTSDHYYADLLKNLQLLDLINRFKKDHVPFRELYASGISPLIPASFKKWVNTYFLRRNKFPWMRKEFLDRIQIDARTYKEVWKDGSVSYSKRYIFSSLYSGLEVYTSELEERSNAWHQLEGRHPFYDRRIVEFVWRLPENQIKRNQYQKYILRTALRGLLPVRVTKRLTKADFKSLFLNSFQADYFHDCIRATDDMSKMIFEQAVIESKYQKIMSYSGTQDPYQDISVIWFTYCFKLLFRTQRDGLMPNRRA